MRVGVLERLLLSRLLERRGRSRISDAPVGTTVTLTLFDLEDLEDLERGRLDGFWSLFLVRDLERLLEEERCVLLPWNDGKPPIAVGGMDGYGVMVGCWALVPGTTTIGAAEGAFVRCEWRDEERRREEDRWREEEPRWPKDGCP